MQRRMAAESEVALVAGRYRLLRRIGAGGMGEVWLAKHVGPSGFSRQVALKITRPGLTDDANARTMFLDEARIAARLGHGNIAQVYELGEERGRLFLAMEYVPGCSLASVLSRLWKEQRAMPAPLACFIAAELCQALGHAHQATDDEGRPLGLVHRDISPQNVLLSDAGEVKLIDFGIALARNRVGHTEAGMLKGKFAYMSPEQAWGRPLDGRSDLFAVGVLLYEMLTGRRLFQGGSEIEVLEQVRSATCPGMPACDPALLEVVRRALAPSRDDRFPTAAALGRALTPFVMSAGAPTGRAELAAFLHADSPTAAVPALPAETAITRTTGRGPIIAVSLLLAPLALLLGALALWLSMRAG